MFLLTLLFQLCNNFILGICTGPKREFFASFCKDVVDPKRRLFIATDDAQLR